MFDFDDEYDDELNDDENDNNGIIITYNMPNAEMALEEIEMLEQDIYQRFSDILADIDPDLEPHLAEGPVVRDVYGIGGMSGYVSFNGYNFMHFWVEAGLEEGKLTENISLWMIHPNSFADYFDPEEYQDKPVDPMQAPLYIATHHVARAHNYLYADVILKYEVEYWLDSELEDDDACTPASDEASPDIQHEFMENLPGYPAMVVDLDFMDPENPKQIAAFKKALLEFCWRYPEKIEADYNTLLYKHNAYFMKD